MPAVSDRLLRYRPWRGDLQGPWAASLAIARVGLRLMIRKRLFWGLYALAAMVFFFFFYGQYLVVWIQQQTATQTVFFGGIPVKMGNLTKFLDRLHLNGSSQTFGNFIWFQGYIGMIVLALAGSVLIGNDFHHRSLPFYLSKPIGRWHYVLGKCLGIGVFVNLLTTLPALILFIQAGLLYDWKSYYVDHFRQFVGILGYGFTLTVCLSVLLMATAVSVRRAVPLIMIWTGIFFLCRVLGSFLVEGTHLDPRWRLVDLWNNLYLVGSWCLGTSRESLRPVEQPAFGEALIVVVIVCVLSLFFLRRRIQAVEIVS
ncbi:MAG: ABC transporter permease [Bacteroidales bacterium]|nr:ABC transporter permease [Bacteroidales bacterium]